MARGGSRGKMRGMHPHTSHFRNVFDVPIYNCSIISILFDSDKPWGRVGLVDSIRSFSSLAAAAKIRYQ